MMFVISLWVKIHSRHTVVRHNFQVAWCEYILTQQKAFDHDLLENLTVSKLP